MTYEDGLPSRCARNELDESARRLMADTEQEKRSVPAQELLVSILVIAVGAFTLVGMSANAPLFRQHFGLSQTGVGAIASTGYIGAMATARIGGAVTDRRGPKIVIVVGLLLFALGALSVLAAFMLGFLYLGVLICGFGYGMINPATTVMANPHASRRRGLTLSLKQSGVPVGGMLAGALLPSVGAAAGWRVSLLLPISMALVVLIIVLWLYKQESAPVTRMAVVLSGHVKLRLPLGYGYGLFMAGTQVSIFAFTAVYLVEARSLSPSMSGLLLALLFVGGITGRLLWGWLSDLRPEDRIRLLQLVACLGTVLLGVLTVIPDEVVPAVLFFVGVCSVGWNGVYIAAVAEAQPERIGAVSGTSMVLINLGAVVFPLIVGILIESFGGWQAGWFACAGLSLGGAGVITVSRRGSAIAATTQVLP